MTYARRRRGVGVTQAMSVGVLRAGSLLSRLIKEVDCIKITFNTLFYESEHEMLMVECVGELSGEEGAQQLARP